MELFTYSYSVKLIYIMSCFFCKLCTFWALFLENNKGSIYRSLWNAKTLKLKISKVFRMQTEAYNSKAATGQLVNPWHNLASFGGWVFCFSAPSLWNYIPKHICDLSSLYDFKTHLKTYLFLSCFSDLSLYDLIHIMCFMFICIVHLSNLFFFWYDIVKRT